MVVCPVAAITTSPESLRALETKFRRLYPARTMQDTWVWRRLPVPDPEERGARP
jgi:hypothetical protein